MCKGLNHFVGLMDIDVQKVQWVQCVQKVEHLQNDQHILTPAGR
jgi:hypothetical protein